VAIGRDLSAGRIGMVTASPHVTRMILTTSQTAKVRSDIAGEQSVRRPGPMRGLAGSRGGLIYEVAAYETVVSVRRCEYPAGRGDSLAGGPR
jgi:hypothetical protein